MVQRLYWSFYLISRLAAQRRLPYAPLADILNRQARAVRRIVRYAFHNVPYYRDTMRKRNLSPDGFRTAADLAMLPVLERSELQRDPEYFTSAKIRLESCLRLKTSGSTGVPRVVYHDTAALYQNAAHGERDRAPMVASIGKWSAYRETVMVSSINASQRAIQDFCRVHAWFPSSTAIQRQYLLLTDPPEKNLALMNRFQPDLLYSYGSYLNLLVGYLGERDAPWSPPKAILSTSDAVSPNARRVLEDRYGVPVFVLYGANEALKIAFECELRTHLHQNCDLYPVRIVGRDGRDAAPGETGEVILSNLVNRATVLLNYRLGDLASLISGSCPCGRSLPLISQPRGRVDELIELPGGEIVHPFVFREMVTKEPSVLQYQVRQVEQTLFHVLLVTASEAVQAGIAERIRFRFAERFGQAARVEVRFVSQLERTQAGKTPAVQALPRVTGPAVWEFGEPAR